VSTSDTDVTICIPTRDRPAHVARLLTYYERSVFRGRVLVGDASVTDHKQYHLRACQAATIHRWPGLPVTQTMARLAAMVTTPYVVYAGDDDYHLPTGLTAAARILAHTRGDNVVACAGAARWYHDRYGSREIIGAYAQPGLDGSSGAERILRLLVGYWVPLYAVCRSWVWRAAWEACAKMTDKALGGEIGPSTLIAAEGRIAVHDGPMLLREQHAERGAWPTLAEWVDSPAFAADIRALARAVARRAGPVCAGDEVESLREGMAHYLLVHQAATHLTVDPVRGAIDRARMAHNIAAHRSETMDGPWARALEWLQ